MIPQNGNVRGVWEEQAEAAKEYVGSSTTDFFLQVLIETSEQLSIHTTGKSASKCKGDRSETSEDIALHGGPVPKF